MSIEERLAMDERAAKKRAYENAARDYGAGSAAMVESLAATEAPDVRWQLENRRNQLLREAEGIQALLDALPAKVPYAAAHALRTLILK